MEYQQIIDSCYCGDAAIKLAKAQDLAASYAVKLLQEPEICRQLGLLKDNLAVLEAHMTAMEMGKSCTSCAKREDGGCCSVYMGNENNDALLLLLNILAGIDVALVCDNGVECCFLGGKGCILLYKPIFCLNYLCGHIRKASTPEMLDALDRKSGALLSGQYEMEALLIRFLQFQGS
jgi:hypothetical protein